MKLFDSHCHLDFEPLSTEMAEVIERAYKSGVAKMVNVGASMRGSEHSVEIANQYPNIWASVGLHPHEADTILDFEGTMEKISALAQSDKVVAIGEIGLDYYSVASDGRQVTRAEKEAQKKLFIAQLKIAEELNLPIIFHVRDAWEDFFSIIGNCKLEIGNCPLGIVHCFTGDSKIAQKLVRLGISVGFTGFVTFNQDKFNQIREAVEAVPMNYILIETDAPFLAPEPYRGKVNEPAYVLEVAKKVAELKKISLDEVAETTTKNAEKLFNISQ